MIKQGNLTQGKYRKHLYSIADAYTDALTQRNNYTDMSYVNLKTTGQAYRSRDF